MKLIKPESFIYQGVSGLERLKKIEAMARISHRSEGKQTEDSWKRFITAVVIEHGDWSVVEHESVTVIFRVDRGITHELVRHRLFSFTQESTRFVNGRKSYPDGLEFIMPQAILDSVGSNGDSPGQWADFLAAILKSEDMYFSLLDRGARPQDARSVLPNCLAATIAVSGNLRNWRHFFLMRTSKETHPDFRRVTIPLLEQFKKEFPILYDDIEPNGRQIENLRKPR